MASTGGVVSYDDGQRGGERRRLTRGRRRATGRCVACDVYRGLRQAGPGGGDDH
jgi:hypothetical protein